MKKNMGLTDKTIRVVIAAIVGILYFTGVITGTLSVILVIVAAILVLTAFINFCPIYSIFGIRSCPIKKDE
jgi:ABC-type antimicrobial peptide transport system permease subunit